MITLAIDETMAWRLENMDEQKLSIIKWQYKNHAEGDKLYFLASETPEIAKVYFGTVFNIPSYRTLRYYVTEGILERPLRLGKETYYEFHYIISMLTLFKELNKYNDSLKVLKKIVDNIRKTNQLEETLDMLEAASDKALNQFEVRDLIRKLQEEEPREILISELEETPRSRNPF